MIVIFNIVQNMIIGLTENLIEKMIIDFSVY